MAVCVSHGRRHGPGMTCSFCKGPGHNVRSCPFVPKDGSAASSAQRENTPPPSGTSRRSPRSTPRRNWLPFNDANVQAIERASGDSTGSRSNPSHINDIPMDLPAIPASPFLDPAGAGTDAPSSSQAAGDEGLQGARVQRNFFDDSKRGGCEALHAVPPLTPRP